MDRDLLAHLPVVLQVARRKSFAAAAGELNMSPSAVSHAVRLVEERLRAPLFARTTRSVALTEAGADFLARIAPALDEIEQAGAAVSAARGRVTGLLRINAPRLAGPLGLTALLARLSERHPDLTVEVVSDEGLADIVAQGFDAGVRLGGMVAQEMVAVRLTPPVHAITVASPAYLARAGEPHTILDLERHNCIGYRRLTTGGTYEWDLRQEDADIAVAVRGTVRVSDALLAVEMALEGIGIAYVFEPLAREHLKSGRLKKLLPRHAMEEPGLFLYYPRRAAEMPKLRALVEMIRLRRK